MNKPPQPITGPTSVPNPSPSPGLTQAAYGPGQPPSLVFATPPPPQMNSAPQPRQFAAGPRTLHQQSYYQNRPAMATSAPRVQTSSGPRAVGPTHVYPPSSQMMMISQQQLSFPGSPQGYFISPGQYRTPYMPPTQQYPVTSGTAGFYPGTSPAEYPAYEPSLAARERRGGGGRGGGRENGRLSLHGAPLTSQRYPGEIRDPNQGGRDITEEIMSGGRSTTTPTPPQVGSLAHREHAYSCTINFPYCEYFHRFHSPDENTEPPASAETPPPPATANPEPEEDDEEDDDEEEDDDKQETDTAESSPSSTPPAEAENTVDTKVGDTVDAPVGPSASLAAQEAAVKMEEPQASPAPAEKAPEKEEKQTEKVKKLEKEEHVASTKLEPTVETHKVAPSSEPEATPAEVAEPLLPNGLPPDTEELSEEVPDASPSQEPTPVAKTSTPTQEVEEKEAEKEAEREEEKEDEKDEDAPPASVSCPSEESTMQAATSVPKKRKNMKELNKKEAIGDLLDAFTEVCNSPIEQRLLFYCRYLKTRLLHLSEQWKPIDPEDKKRYDREFLLGFQFISASMNKPDGLPSISDVVLEKANKTPMRPPDPARMMNVGPDFTPSYLGNLGSRSVGGPRGPVRDQGQRKEPRKIILSSMSLGDDVQLNKAEKAWKPTAKKSTRSRNAEEAEAEDDDPEQAKTKELFKRLRSILNKLTPQKFQELMKQVTDLTIDTEERLKGTIDLIFEKAISEPNFSVAYANMCRCLLGLKVPTSDKPGVFVNFRKLLLNRCQKEFEKDQDDDEIFERKQKELEAAKEGEERERLRVELQDSRDQARRRSLGNIKFIGELFKLKMLTEAIMHDCVVKLLKNHDEESLECLCRLLSTIGKDLDFEKAKPRMDQYFTQMDKIIKEKKTSSRIRFMLQDVIDLRRCSWVPRRGDQGPKTIDQIHKEAEMEEHREHIKVQQQLLNKKEGGGGGGRMGGNMGGRGSHSQGGGRNSQPQDEGWNTVPISKNRPIDTTRLSKITKPGSLDFNNQLLAPGGKGMWGSWGKGSSGGTGAKPASGEQESGRPATSTLNRFSALQQSGSLSATTDSDRKAPQRSSSSRERGGDREKGDREGRDGRSTPNQITKRSFSRESQERGGRAGDLRAATEPVRRVASMTDDRDRGSRDRGSRDRGIKRESAPTPPPSLPKPALSEEELEKKSNAIIEEYLHINDMKEALQCVTELDSATLLFVFVRSVVESTLERSTIARERAGLLLHHLVKAEVLPSEQYYKGLEDTLEAAEDTAIDIPHIWLYLAELITPMLHEGGIPMGQIFREISKPLVPLGQAGVLLVQILKLLCNEMTPKKVGTMWAEGGLNWSDFLPEDEDVNKFVTEQKVEFTTGEELESKEVDEKKVLTGEELSKQLDRLIQDKANNQRIRDWAEANLDEQQTVSNQFVRALMTSVCQSAIICNPYKVDAQQIKQRASLLQRYLSDEQKELQALYALQALMVHMEQPANLLRMFFDALYDEDVIKEEAFYNWESSKDPAEQTGKGVALKSVTAFFTWLREPEEDSDRE
uniref:Eukaryotic translation initiation factor 4 gamma, 1a n=1 Tax=Gasterosteus aculeatus aculeatus TaxID=481459 RepID=A0AAQ4PTP9_GASAC